MTTDKRVSVAPGQAGEFDYLRAAHLLGPDARPLRKRSRNYLLTPQYRQLDLLKILEHSEQECLHA